MQLSGVYAVAPTVFTEDGAFDPGGQAAVVEAYGHAGVAGVVVLGVMGEAGQLSPDETRAVVATSRRAAAGLPVVAGLGIPGRRQVAAATRLAGLGIDGVLAGLTGGTERAEVLGAVAGIGPPVVAQHHPGATGVRLTVAEVVATVVDAGAVACKVEAPPTPDLVAALRQAGGPPAFGGLSARMLLEELEEGAVGAMTGLATPELLVETVARWQSGDHAGARAAYERMSRWLRLEIGPAALVTRKEAWRQRGVIDSSRVRAAAPLEAATKRAVTRRLRDAGVDVTDPYPGA